MYAKQAQQEKAKDKSPLLVVTLFLVAAFGAMFITLMQGVFTHVVK